jgi:protoporphyrinogen oxidase
MKRSAIIIGAGPAGLTAAYEMVTRTDIIPVIIEKSYDIGGISKTLVYKGNRMDIGGHRFFSKSDLVMKWWQNILPLQGTSPAGPDPEKTDMVMLIRNRLSRIFFLGKFFDYPVSLSRKTINNLGLARIVSIGWSYIKIRISPLKKIVSLEDFFISRFGRKLYETFFRDYTEKVWGVPCSEIPSEWGAQRVKGLSVSHAILHSLKSFFRVKRSIEQKNTDTSLIEQFLYPKLGPGQMWETVAGIIEEKGGKIIFNSEVIGLKYIDNQITELVYRDCENGLEKNLQGDYFFSSMPVKDLIAAMGNNIPSLVREVAEGLQYRDFITVGLLLNKLCIKNETGINTINGLVPDNWIYIQEKGVKVGRLQIFNNWSPYLVADPNKVWMGLEYFCNEGDSLWEMSDNGFIDFAINELQSINIIDRNDVIDSTIFRMPKTYPAYFGTYTQFSVIRDFTDRFTNLFLVGRNGMHRYNNQDHSMLTAITAVNNIIEGHTSKSNIWDINTEEQYHEEK